MDQGGAYHNLGVIQRILLLRLNNSLIEGISHCGGGLRSGWSAGGDGRRPVGIFIICNTKKVPATLISGCRHGLRNI